MSPSKNTSLQNDWLEKAKKVIAKTATIDLHTHLGLWESKGLSDMGIFTYQGDENLLSNINDMIAGGCKSGNVLITSDIPIMELGLPGNKNRDFTGEEAWEEYERQLALLHQFFEKMPIALATKISDIDKIWKNGEVAIFLSTEGGHMVEDHPERMEQIYKDGIRRFQPIHYAKTKIGDNQTDPSTFAGLTPIGKEIIQETNRLKMVIDVAHATYQTTRQIANITNTPLVLSHTMMKYHSEKYGSYHYENPRWISKEHALLIAETGGLVGTWPLPKPFGTENEAAFVEAVLKMVDTIGIDHVGWATDYIDVVMPTSKVFSNYRNFPKLCAKFLEHGFSEDDLTKFIGGNAARIHREVVGE